MGSKSVLASAVAGAYLRYPSVRRHHRGITPRLWHPVVYLDLGPVRFAGCATIAAAMRQARSLAESLGARTFNVQPGRWTVVPIEGGRDE